MAQEDISIWKTFSLEVMEIKTFWLVSCDRLKVECQPQAHLRTQSLFPRKGSEWAEACPGLPPVLYLWLSPSKQRVNVLRMSRQHGMESGYLELSEKKAELEGFQDSKLPAARPGKEKLSICLQRLLTNFSISFGI